MPAEVSPNRAAAALFNGLKAILNSTLEGSFNDTSFTYAGTFFDRDVRYLWDYNDYVESVSYTHLTLPTKA